MAIAKYKAYMENKRRVIDEEERKEGKIIGNKKVLAIWKTMYDEKKKIEEEEAEKKLIGMTYLNYHLFMPKGRNPDWDCHFPLSDPGIGIHPVNYFRGSQGADQ